MKNFILVLSLTGILLTNCIMDKKMEFKKGSYGYDVEFLNKHLSDLIILNNQNASIVIAPEYQGRIMTSSAKGFNGKSFGWINYDLISSGKLEEHINAFGGEERFWIGPEGGQFSIYFEEGKEFIFDNWFVPKEIDTDPFEIIEQNDVSVKFKKAMNLVNYSGSRFNLVVNRKIQLLQNDDISKLLNVTIEGGVEVVGFQTENRITNSGESAWTKETGALSIWILSMLNPSDKTIAVFPYKIGDESILGDILTSDYFGEISNDRLKVENGCIFFKCDGKSRGKIGLSPKRAKSFSGSYDAKGNVLTIANYLLPENTHEYVNSLWEIQESPFSGDAVNSYNDGPLDDGSQLGPFYEIESSSPAAFLSPGESLSHFHRTFHFTGDKRKLSEIAETLLGVSIDKIEAVF